MHRASLRTLLLFPLLAAAMAACRPTADRGVHIERLPVAAAPVPAAPAGTPVATVTLAGPPPLVSPGLPEPPSARPVSTSPAAVSVPGEAQPAGRHAAPNLVRAPPPARPAVAAGEDPALLDVIVRALGPDASATSVVTRRLADGAGARWNADRVHYAASLYKLAVLYEAYRQRRLGLLEFDRRVVLGPQHYYEDLGTIDRLPLGPDGDLAVGDALQAMITFSDNASAAVLLDVLGHASIDAAMLALGLTATSVSTEYLPTDAADMAVLLEAIARGDGLDAGAPEEMVELLLAQEARTGIPRGVPDGVPVANKTGTWPGSTHDVALVFAPTGAYVLAVLTEASWDWEPITRVSAAVYAYWGNSDPVLSGR